MATIHYACNTSTLVLVQIVQRHGDRTPTSFYPGDPYANDSWPDGLGALTPKGKHRMYEAGQQFRQRYGQWLGVTPKTIYQRSAAYDRCLESAYAVSAGMYRPEGRWVWDKQLELAHLWQPMAVQTVPSAIDALLEVSATCPTANNIQDQDLNSANATAYIAQHQKFVNQINNLTGNNFTTVDQLASLYDTLYCELNYDPPKAPPAWLRAMGVNQTMAQLRAFEYEEYELETDSVLAQRLRAGPLIGVLIANMQNATTMSPDNTMVKVYHYLTHDINVAFVYRTLNDQVVVPSYGSALVFELHNIDGNYIVKVFYANNTNGGQFEWLIVELPTCQVSNETIGDSYANDSWPDGLGALTTKGKHRMYETGRQLRHRYGQWLGVSPKTIYQRSAADDRCLESAYAVSAGMYRPEGRWVWDQPVGLAHLWQPMAVHTVPTAIDALLSYTSTCPVADQIANDQVTSNAAAAYINGHGAFINQFNTLTGANFTTLFQYRTLYYTIYEELNYLPPKPAPHWMRIMGVERTINQLAQFAAKYSYLWSQPPIVQRLRAGPLIGQIIERMRNVLVNDIHNDNIKNMHFTDSTGTYDTSTLILVQIVQRHGDRTPLQFYHGDPYANDSWPDGLGELTPQGKHRMYETGRQLRHRYGQWLGVSPKTIYQRSAATNRCLESAYAVSAGMYRPEGRWVWDRPLELAHLWQPMAVQTVPSDIDPLLEVPTCPAADNIYNQQVNSPAATGYVTEHRVFVNEINKLTGANFTTVGQLAGLYDTLYCELNYDPPKPPPAWLRAMGVNQTMAQLRAFLHENFYLYTNTVLVQRLRAGPLIGVLIDNMQNAIAMAANSTRVKVYHYLTHDLNISFVYRILNGDPYANDSWQDGLGGLTPKGKHRMYEAGRQLRHRYGQWLGVSPKTIYQRSAATNRCLESAYAVFAGMYRPEGRWVWDRPLKLAHLWQPMAVQTVPTAIDALLDVSATCPTASAIETQTTSLPAANAY
ncbi:unnamed protein product [Medioppia subpectinata]|uniref:Histidine acid phosphatase n=1 Tax=Medioppia subpectinata TaxID=1979941 RepID=A0A7R9KD48_9ACAR|nr:unnamed protein product [Medioppia subpectinata]CAG2101297.1 unnamed protein product [Medioppia subpectinata]